MKISALIERLDGMARTLRADGSILPLNGLNAEALELASGIIDQAATHALIPDGHQPRAVREANKQPDKDPRTTTGAIGICTRDHNCWGPEAGPCNGYQRFQ